MLGTQSEEVNVMLVNASRYVAQQFVDRIRDDFISSGTYDLLEENLLDYEQFRKIFVKQKPQFSLLLNTDGGYFAYCVIAPHLLQKGNEVSLKTENAMKEVKKYLENNKSNDKNKILVADDSDFMLKSMEELLKGDYNVSVANSGLSVIRCISLDRPDLIILDYDMPVCNGAQTLEMIRSEKDFANIPVIFLTGRSDREAVEKIIPLKPEGYMVKNMPPEDIKKNIDNFFARKKR